MNNLKQTLILGLLFVSISAFSQFSGQGPVTLTAPTGVTNIQWFNNSTGTPVAISGATNATYQTSTPGVYYAQFDKNTASSCTSSKTVATVIMNQGSSTTLNGATNNSGALSYQWKNQSTAISGANSANLTVTEGGLYTLDVTNSSCTVQSESIYVFVLSTPVLPDLNPTLEIASLEFTPTASPRDFLVKIFEINNSSGTATPALSFRVSKLSAFNITYPTTSGNSSVFETTANSNGDWNFTESTNFITATIKSGVTIPASGSKIIGFTVARKANISSNTNQNITVTVINGSIGEVKTDNNIVQTTITAN
jgi:hypothetical protein